MGFLLLYVFLVLIWCVLLHETVLQDVPVTVLFGSLCVAAMVFYLTHRLGHEKQAITLWFRAHTHGHHYLAYPSHTPQSDKYIMNTIDVYQLNTFAYVVSGMLHLAFSYVFILRRMDYILALAATELMLLYIENYFHREVHKCTSHWRHCKWFRYIQSCHLQHHRLYNVNFAVVALWTDWLFGTLAVPTDKDTDNSSNRKLVVEEETMPNSLLPSSQRENTPSTVDYS